MKPSYFHRSESLWSWVENGFPPHRRGSVASALDDSVRQQALMIIRERYADFGPTLAHEKLTELHGVPVSVSTIRNWMLEDGIWQSRQARAGRAHQPRNRRACVGELVQIDAHRLLRDDLKLEDIFTWQEECTLSKDLVLHYKRIMFLVEQTPETLALRKHRCRVYERADGSMFWRWG